MRKNRFSLVVLAMLASTHLSAATFTATLSGAAENPPVASAGTGSVIADYDASARTLRISGSFSGLTGGTTAAHIHCCMAPPGNAGVATTTPSLVGFPLGVTAGAFDVTLDLTQASSFSPAFLTVSGGGTVEGAEAALAAGLAAGHAYFNIHTTFAPGGEIRGFFVNAADASADVQIVKTALPALVVPGSNFSYIISVTNAGPDDAVTVELTDVLSSTAGSTLVSFAQTDGDAWSCTAPAPPALGTITCTRTIFPASKSAEFEIVMNVDAATAPGTTLSNTAAISAETSDPTPANNSSTATATVAVSDMSVTKSASAAAISADNDLVYTITVSQLGALDAANVSLTDVLPAGTTFTSLEQSGPAFSCTTPAVGSNGTITCTSALVEGGSTTTFTIMVYVLPTFTGTLTNTASVSSDTADANSANDSATATTEVSPPVTDLAITKTIASRSANQITFTLVATNNGPATATGVVITDVLPAGLTFVSATPSVGSCSGTATVSCSVGTLTEGASASVTLVATLTGTSALSNTATVAGNETDPNPANNSAAVAITPDHNVPSLSTTALLFMLIGLGIAGWFATRS